MTSTRKLRLGPLPRNENVKLTFSCPLGLKDDLERYAQLHAQTYGEVADAAALIPHMLNASSAKIACSRDQRSVQSSPVQ